MPESREIPEPPAVPVESTADLIRRASVGEPAAESLLFQRYQPVLRRLAHGRLPGAARDLKDTEDIVQETLVVAFRRLGSFEYRGEGAFLAYLRQILLNQIRQEVRRRKSRPTNERLHDGHRDPGRSPLENAAWMESLQVYEEALGELSEEHRMAIVMRIELGHAYEDIAQALESPSANAARMLVARALARLAVRLGERGIERHPE